MGAHKDMRIPTLFDLLSRQGALRILELAEHGLMFDVKFRKFAGVTRKMARARIAELMRAGLITNRNNGYFQTPFGKAIWRKYIPELRDAFMSGKNPGGG